MSHKNQERIKVAIQKSGRLTDRSLELLERCGLKYTRGRDQLIGFGENMPVDFLLVRDDDIPGLVRDDVCDLGIVGMNVLEERRLQFVADGEGLRGGAGVRVRVGVRVTVLVAVTDEVGVLVAEAEAVGVGVGVVVSEGAPAVRVLARSTLSGLF